MGDSFIAKLLVHGKAAEVSTSALDALLVIKLEAVAVEKGTSRETDVGADTWRSGGAQRRLHVPIEKAGNTAPSECGMSKEKVQVALERIRGETCDCAARLGDDGMQSSQTLLPSSGIGRARRPRGKLLW